jgi:hypothetical protein
MSDYTISVALRNMLGPKWKEITRIYFEWVLENYQDDGEDEFPTGKDIVEKALPAATEILHKKGENWLSFFRKLENASLGKVKLGRHTFPTRFVWHTSRLPDARYALTFINKEALEQPEISLEVPQLPMAETSYSFPLRQDTIVQIRIPSDVSAQELERLADFIKLLPHS